MKSISDITVLFMAGGKGTRLASVVDNVPKPMADVHGIPFLQYLVEYYQKFGFKKFCFATGYKSQVIEDYFGDGSKWNLEFSYSVEKAPLGTGGAIKKAFIEKKYSELVVVNADTFFKLDLKAFIESAKAVASMALCFQKDSSRYGSVSINEKNEVETFIEKQEVPQAGLINAGIYYLDQSIKGKIKDGFCSLETEILPDLAKEKKVFAKKFDGKFIDIGIPTDYFYFQNNVQKFL